MIEGSGSIPLTSGSGSGRPQNMWTRWIRIRIRIRNTARKILTTKKGCLALLLGPKGFLAVGERKHTYLNGPTVTLRPIPILVWQRGEGLDGVLVVVLVIRISINQLVGARTGEDRPCAGGGRGSRKIFYRQLGAILRSAQEIRAAFMRNGSFV